MSKPNVCQFIEVTHMPSRTADPKSTPKLKFRSAFNGHTLTVVYSAFASPYQQARDTLETLGYTIVAESGEYSGSEIFFAVEQHTSLNVAYSTYLSKDV